MNLIKFREHVDWVFWYVSVCVRMCVFNVAESQIKIFVVRQNAIISSTKFLTTRNGVNACRCVPNSIV